MKYFIPILLLLISSSLIGQIPEKAEDISPLLISETIPSVEVMDLEGRVINTNDLLTSKKSVLILYRGGWCPYCNTHLSEVGLVENEIKALGYQVVAMSPDAPAKLKETEQKGEFQYNLYSDAKGDFIKAMGIAFQAPERYGDLLSRSSAEMNPGLLPVPSLFVIDEEGAITFEYISPNYKGRIGADLLLDVLKRLNEETE
ncbi:MAG: AhpC/TSA family protein [Saprospiraceae bacterium]|nr:AhpC/TSA family protein [Saprospiraceae bacterium]